MKMVRVRALIPVISRPAPTYTIRLRILVQLNVYNVPLIVSVRHDPCNLRQAIVEHQTGKPSLWSPDSLFVSRHTFFRRPRGDVWFFVYLVIVVITTITYEVVITSYFLKSLVHVSRYNEINKYFTLSPRVLRYVLVYSPYTWFQQ